MQNFRLGRGRIFSPGRRWLGVGPRRESFTFRWAERASNYEFSPTGLMLVVVVGGPAEQAQRVRKGGGLSKSIGTRGSEGQR